MVSHPGLVTSSSAFPQRLSIFALPVRVLHACGVACVVVDATHSDFKRLCSNVDRPGSRAPLSQRKTVPCNATCCQCSPLALLLPQRKAYMSDIVSGNVACAVCVFLSLRSWCIDESSKIKVVRRVCALPLFVGSPCAVSPSPRRGRARNVQPVPVVNVDGRQVGNGQPGLVTTRLREAFGEMILRPGSGTPLPKFK